MASVVIETNVLAVLAEFASADDLRIISAVVFSDDRAMATNGHIMVAIPIKTHGMRFGVWRRSCFAAVAAQDASERHFSRTAMRLGVDLEASAEGESVVIDSPHGHRQIEISRAGDGIVSLDLDHGKCVLKCDEPNIKDFPFRGFLDNLAVDKCSGPFESIGFASHYFAAIERIAGACGYAHRPMIAKAWGAKGVARFEIPADADPDEPVVTIGLMPLGSRPEGSETKRMRVHSADGAP